MLSKTIFWAAAAAAGFGHDASVSGGGLLVARAISTNKKTQVHDNKKKQGAENFLEMKAAATASGVVDGETENENENASAAGAPTPSEMNTNMEMMTAAGGGEPQETPRARLWKKAKGLGPWVWSSIVEALRRLFRFRLKEGQGEAEASEGSSGSNNSDLLRKDAHEEGGGQGAGGEGEGERVPAETVRVPPGRWGTWGSQKQDADASGQTGADVSSEAGPGEDDGTGAGVSGETQVVQKPPTQPAAAPKVIAEAEPNAPVNPGKVSATHGGRRGTLVTALPTLGATKRREVQVSWVNLPEHKEMMEQVGITNRGDQGYWTDNDKTQYTFNGQFYRKAINEGWKRTNDRAAGF